MYIGYKLMPNHIRYQHIKLLLCGRLIFCNHTYDFGINCTPIVLLTLCIAPIIIIIIIITTIMMYFFAHFVTCILDKINYKNGASTDCLLQPYGLKFRQPVYFRSEVTA